MRNPDNPILGDTCLCAIVRNEEINPAGGIAKFCEAHLPLFSTAEIVDTGSVDRTPEILREMQKRFPWMRVHPIQFQGFADSRNHGLDRARETEATRVMVLDADERLYLGSAQIIAERLKDCPCVPGWSFRFKYVYSNGGVGEPDGMNPRLFKLLPGVRFIGEGPLGDNEYPHIGKKRLNYTGDCWSTGETIYHFCPSPLAYQQKARRVYGKHYIPIGAEWDIAKVGLPIDQTVMQTHPSQLPWKQLNPLSLKPQTELENI